MTLFYECDSCHKKITNEPKVYLRGILGTVGGILLPDYLHKKHFCCPECFWKWVNKYNPANLDKENAYE